MSSSAATPVANYCVVEGGFGGTGNLSTNPFFSNAANPMGADGVWLTADDGLKLGCGSSAYNTGTNTDTPTMTSWATLFSVVSKTLARTKAKPLYRTLHQP